MLRRLWVALASVERDETIRSEKQTFGFGARKKIYHFDRFFRLRTFAYKKGKAVAQSSGCDKIVPNRNHKTNVPRWTLDTARHRNRIEGENVLATELRLSAGTLSWGLQGLCQLHRVPFAADLVLQQFPPPYDLLSLQRAAQALGLKSGWRTAHLSELPQLPLPFVAVLGPSN